MNPFRLLKKDHRKVSKLFRKLEDTTERAVKTRERLFSKVKMELDVHALIEEKHLYPALEDKAKTEDQVEHSYDEHAEVKTMLKELDKLEKNDPSWYLKFIRLVKDVEHHVKEEEGELFPNAEKTLSKPEQRELGDKMYETKLAELEKRK